MKKLLLLALGLSMGSTYADDGSPSLKAESQAVVRNAGYQCDKVNDVYPAAFGGSVKVFCDDVYQYTIRDKGGRYIVEVDD
ncbi:TPA: hypothetical protein I9Y23_003407 [Kluyvera ascorbata]|uniref:DUF1161 domain-containing protein n=1 Tax=Kluyvera genomosp. 2 TaxID=2774054 RepID=A0A2T2XZ84_9ENTR|nr:hypothetical protein [Pectobacterium brasiliense]PSR45576.1 hypothetical protein C8256_17765 [Kluyvera genomosp. 2]HAT3919741.1 hypothetical protein [Kluyvera ascorbata]KHT08555.1 hypothetical protein RC91_03245 [Pectobacterium brasiliense]KHT43804.1 hypothetical protein RD02_01550 [Pectobacterium brasiliense]HAT3944985.1 hypothetical protein [Kluyvera ascorbata]